MSTNINRNLAELGQILYFVCFTHTGEQLLLMATVFQGTGALHPTHG